MEFCGRVQVLGGVSPRSFKRYRAVRDKHIKFCAWHGIATWKDFDKRAIEKYGNWLSKKYADRTIYVELTLLKSVNRWLIENADSKMVQHYRHLRNEDAPRKMEQIDFTGREDRDAPPAGEK